MPKFCYDTFLDAALDTIEDNCIELTVVEGEPSSYADATTAKGSGGSMLVTYTVSGSDFTKADDTSGRKLTVSAQTGNTASASGTGDHIALCTGSVLQYYTTATSTGITSGASVDIDAWDINVKDPT